MVRHSFRGIVFLCYGVDHATTCCARECVCVCVEPQSSRYKFSQLEVVNSFQGMEVFFSPKLDDLMAGFEDLANDDAEGASDDVVWAARTTALIKKFEVSRKVFHLISLTTPSLFEYC